MPTAPHSLYSLPPSRLPPSRLPPSRLPPSRLPPSRLPSSRLPPSRLSPSRFSPNVLTQINGCFFAISKYMYSQSRCKPEYCIIIIYILCAACKSFQEVTMANNNIWFPSEILEKLTIWQHLVCMLTYF